MKKIRIYLKKLYAFLRQMPGWIWLIPILILAVNVRLTYLTKADIWHDEGYTAAIIQRYHARLAIDFRQFRSFAQRI